jgi:hypothetical protein
MKLEKIMIALLVLSGFTVLCHGAEPAIKFGFKESLLGSGMIKNKGSIRFSASVLSKSTSPGTCFTETANGLGFIIGTENQNYIKIDAKQEIDKLFAGGFKIKIGYTLPAVINSKSKSNLVLVAKYDHGLQARSFSLNAAANGSIAFIVSGNGEKTVSCGKKLLIPGKRAEFEAHFIPGLGIALYQNGEKMTSKKINLKQIFPSAQPLTIGARMFKGKSPINFGVGVIDLLEISPLSNTAVPKKKKEK